MTNNEVVLRKIRLALNTEQIDMRERVASKLVTARPRLVTNREIFTDSESISDSDEEKPQDNKSDDSGW